MATETHDVVIVGARCAGAALGTLLARTGARVLLVDRDALPSDQVLSTHTIHPPGMDVLDDLGVGDAVRTLAPPTRVLRLRKGPSTADLTLGEDRREYCPRRQRLDGLIQDAARRAGAEIRDRTRATGLVVEDGRVRGVRASRGGREETLRADLVVGADGRRSFVAATVGAEEYLGYDAPRAMYWAYWDAPGEWTSDAYPFGMYIGHVGGDIRVVFQTDHGQLLVGSLPPVDEARGWRSDPEGALRRNLAGDPVTEHLAARRAPDGPVRGTLKERYYFRRAAGPGWVLVGDAGHHKEFVSGDGITEALLQARTLAPAIARGSDDALARWWRARDVEALPTWFWGQDEGALGAPGPLETLVVGKVGEDPELCRRMTALVEHACSPYDAIPASQVLPWVIGALVRGRIGVLPGFLAQGRRAMAFSRAMKERRRALDQAPAGGAEA